MTQFQKGQEVEVEFTGTTLEWRKAKIVSVCGRLERYIVEFRSGVRVAFNKDEIRAIAPRGGDKIED
jgi:hypothetical protein